MFRPGTMAKELETITFALKSGELSNVIETKQGYVILKVIDHQQAGIPPYKDVENQVMDQLYMQRHRSGTSYLSHQAARTGIYRNQAQ